MEAVRHAAFWLPPGRQGVGALTAALVERKGYNIVAAEADWPDANRANRWARGMSDEPDAHTSPSDFTRSPRWSSHHEADLPETFPTGV